MRKSTFFSLLAFYFFLAPTISHAVEFHVLVETTDREGLASAYVQLKKSDGQSDARITDINGTASFGNISGGTISIKVIYNGLDFDSGDFELSGDLTDFAYHITLDPNDLPTEDELNYGLRDLIDVFSIINEDQLADKILAALPHGEYYSTEQACEQANPGWECDSRVVDGVTKYYKSRLIPPPPPAPKVIGNIDGVYTFSNGLNYLVGWACQQQDPQSIWIHIYLNGPAGTGSILGGFKAEVASEPAVAAACASTGSAYRFQIPMDSYSQAHGGKTIWVHGISPVGGSNLTIANSGAFKVPLNRNCTTQYPGVHNIVGLSNGDPRFLCYDSRWYDCGWQGNDPAWESKATQGQRVGGYTCDLENSTWNTNEYWYSSVVNFVRRLYAYLLYRPDAGDSDPGQQGWITQLLNGFYNFTQIRNLFLTTAEYRSKHGAPVDFSGDQRSDIVIYRPPEGKWYVSGVGALNWGVQGDKPIAGDFNGDTRADYAIFRPWEAKWYIYSFGIFNWGIAGDIPVAADYDGDGKTDIAVYRPGNHNWYVLKSSKGFSQTAIDGTSQYGWGAPGDIPMPADYDGDGRADYAVYRPSTAVWYIVNSLSGQGSTTQWGQLNDIPVTGDFDGDAKADIAVFRPGDGTWYILQSKSQTGFSRQWGLSGDIPVKLDFDGDLKTDIAVYRPSSGHWYVMYSSQGYTYNTVQSFVFGAGAGDIPVGP